ncbi:MAG TPA: hypothetical protein VHF02_09225 [Luteimonas sp.]|nr:hypothetical protein [Luteimonas sp.]
MSFVAELKQRKMFRVATIYLLVAWVGTQAASIALPAFDAPAWVLRVVILLDLGVADPRVATVCAGKH